MIITSYKYMIAMDQCENRTQKLQSQNQYLGATTSAKIVKFIQTCTQINYETGLRMLKIPTLIR